MIEPWIEEQNPEPPEEGPDGGEQVIGAPRGTLSYTVQEKGNTVAWGLMPGLGRS